jgi:hypothetical protein
VLVEQPMCALDKAGTAADAPMAGVLGGSRAEFERFTGPPQAAPDETFAMYQLKACPPMMAMLTENGYIRNIAIASPRVNRTRDWDPDVAAEGDWTMEEAEAVARSFLPDDAVFGEGMDDDRGWFAVPGYSDTLRREVPRDVYLAEDETLTYGGFTYNIGITDTGSVSLMLLELLVADNVEVPSGTPIAP